VDEKRFAFILCGNDAQYEEACQRFIRALDVPGGYQVEIHVIHGAASMTGGYNQGMRQTDAKYKIYLHQDSFVTERRFLFKLLEIFSDPEVGMIGMVGSPKLPPSGVMWDGYRVGANYECNILLTECRFFGTESPIEGDFCIDVEAVDGFLLATQADLPWREDLFGGWDFYDISQSFEFWRAGYRVVVPYMQRPWCLHDCGIMNLSAYDHWREVFLREYRQ
jgi:hypothetical protein